MDRITSFPWDFVLIGKMLGTLSHWKHSLTERNPPPLQNNMCVLDLDTSGIMQNIYLIIPIQFLKCNLITNCAEKMSVRSKSHRVEYNRFLTGMIPTSTKMKCVQITTRYTNQKSIPTPVFIWSVSTCKPEVNRVHYKNYLLFSPYFFPEVEKDDRWSTRNT